MGNGLSRTRSRDPVAAMAAAGIHKVPAPANITGSRNKVPQTNTV